jgi:hypothetical protein
MLSFGHAVYTGLGAYMAIHALNAVGQGSLPLPVSMVPLADKALTTSGSYHNFFEAPDGKRYSHIIDPKTGMPVASDLVSVTVLYDDATNHVELKSRSCSEIGK